MDDMGRNYLLQKVTYYVLISCIKNCVRRQFIQNYFKIFNILLIWDENVG